MKEQTLHGYLLSRRKLKFLTAAAFTGVCLSACGGSSDSGNADSTVSEADTTEALELSDGADLDGGVTQDGTPVNAGDINDTGTTSEDLVGLAVGSVQRCATLNEPIELVITRDLQEGEVVGEDGEAPNITGFVGFTQIYGDSLNIISRTDESAIFSMTQQDIVGITADIENGSITAFLAAYDTTAPANFIMRKPVSDGCLYAFKSGDYCGTGLSRVGSIAFSRNDLSMTAVGCELQNPDAMPVIDLPASL